jgi:hypothetical protein
LPSALNTVAMPTTRPGSLNRLDLMCAADSDDQLVRDRARAAITNGIPPSFA